MTLSKFFRQHRPAWVAGLAVAAIAVALAWPPVRAKAVEFLQLFRVRQVEVVQVDPAQLMDNMGSTSQIQQMLSDQVQVEELGEAQQVTTAEEAASVAGIPIRLPNGLGEPTRLVVQPGVHLSFTVDLPRVRALLAEIGHDDIVLPDNLDGAKVSAAIPRTVTAAYGHCPMGEVTEDTMDMNDERFGWDCTVFVQLPTPTVSAPAGLNLTELGKAFLQVMGLSEDEAARFSERVDWATTLVVPVPRYSAAYRDVQVDGVRGTLIEQPDGRRPAYAILWVKDGIVYALSGRGDSNHGLAIANDGLGEQTR